MLTLLAAQHFVPLKEPTTEEERKTTEEERKKEFPMVATLLRGVPVFGPIATLMVADEIAEHPHPQAIESILSALVLVFEDLPDFVVDLRIISKQSDDDDAVGILAYYVSFTVSFIGFA